MKRLIAVLVLVAVVGFGTSRGYDWWNFNVNTPVSTDSEPVVFHIDPGELPSQVADDLVAQRLIRDRQCVRPVPQAHRGRVQLPVRQFPAESQHDASCRSSTPFNMASRRR